jgi:hypothetical protein
MYGAPASDFTNWQGRMPDDRKPRHPETNFLPPLNMILSFFKKQDKKRTVNDQEPEEVKEEVKRIIEKINADDEATKTRDQETRD